MSLLNSSQQEETANTVPKQDDMVSTPQKYNMIQHLKTAFMSSTTTFILTMHFLSASHADTAHIQNTLANNTSPDIISSPSVTSPVAEPVAQIISASNNSPAPALATTSPVLAKTETAKEKSLKAAKLRNDLAIKNANTSLENISKQLAKLKLDKVEIQQHQASLNDFLGQDNEAANIPQWIRSPIFRKLLAKQYNLRNEFDLVKISLMPAHPRYRRLKARTKALDKDIQNELYKIRIRLRQKLASAARTEIKLAKSLADLNKRLIAAKKDQYKLEALSKVAELSLVNAQKADIEDRTRMLNTALEQHGQNLLTSGDNTSPRLTQLLDQYIDMNMELAALSTKWSDSHPRIRQTKQHLALLQSQISGLARKDIAKMDDQARSLGAKQDALEKQAEQIAIREVLEIEAEAKAEQAKKEAALKLEEEDTLKKAAAQGSLNEKRQDGSLSLAYGRGTDKKVKVDTQSLMLP